MASEKDPKGARGGDTGKTDQKGKGEQAEKPCYVESSPLSSDRAGAEFGERTT